MEQSNFLTPKEFIKKSEDLFKDLRYKERKNDDSRTYINWYYQNFGAMNMIVDAEYFDITGGQYWITIPCNIEEYENFFIQLNIRHFDEIGHRGCPNDWGHQQLDAITCQVLFIDGKDWTNLGVYPFSHPFNQKKPKGQKLAKKYVDATFHNNHWKFYNPNEESIMIFEKDMVRKLDDFLNKDFKNIGVALHQIKQIKSANQRRKLFNKEIKPLFKLALGSHFTIR